MSYNDDHLSSANEHFSRPNLKYIIGGSESNEDGFYNNHDIMDSDNSTYKPASSRSYVDETIHFSSLENTNLNFNNIVIDTIPTNIDSKYLSLDENYKSCKSILGSGNGNLRCRSSDNAKTAENIISKAKIITVTEDIYRFCYLSYYKHIMFKIYILFNVMYLIFC